VERARNCQCHALLLGFCREIRGPDSRNRPTRNLKSGLAVGPYLATGNDMHKVPVLVTGGAGYIGSHAVLALRDAGWPIAVIDDLSNGSTEVIPDDVAFYEGNIADGQLVE